MSETYENCPGLVNSRISYASQSSEYLAILIISQAITWTGAQH